MVTCRTNGHSIVGPHRMGQWRASRRGAVLLLCGLLAACVAPAPVRVPAPAPAADVADVYSQGYATLEPADLVFAERNAAAARDLAALAALWDADAVIREMRGASGPGDDYTWRGRAAILDRYKVAVFPNPPPPLAEAPIRPVHISGDRAMLRNGVDTWSFLFRDGRWWIAELVINGEAGNR